MVRRKKSGFISYLLRFLVVIFLNPWLQESVVGLLKDAYKTKSDLETAVENAGWKDQKQFFIMVYDNEEALITMAEEDRVPAFVAFYVDPDMNACMIGPAHPDDLKAEAEPYLHPKYRKIYRFALGNVDAVLRR
jgi:hypothetical protein